MEASPDKNTLDQSELDELLLLSGFLKEEDGDAKRKSLVEEIRDAILDSGKLTLREWESLRARLADIEQLIPHIDLIITLKRRRRQS